MPGNPKNLRLKLRVWLVLWVICTGVSLALWSRPRNAAIKDDEIYWIGSAYYFDLAFVRHDWSNADWQLLPARENPPVAKYVIGLSLAVADQHITSPDLLACFYLLFEGVPGAWGEGEDYAKRAAIVARMDPHLRETLSRAKQINLAPQLLIPPRIAMVVCSVITSLLVFWLGQTALSRLAALLASQALLMHPVVVEAYNYALSDAVALLFSTLAVVATFRWTLSFLSPATRLFSRVSWSLAVGLALALACGAKMNSLVIVLLAGASLAFVAWRNWRHSAVGRLRGTLVLGSGIFAVALGVFVAFNPTIIQRGATGLAATVTEHRLTEAIQAKFLRPHLVTLAPKAAAVAQMTVFSPIACALLIACAIAGLALAPFAIRFIAAWWMIVWICVTLWIPFAQLRYVMPLMAPTVLLAAASLEALILRVVKNGTHHADSSPIGAATP